MRLLQMDLNGKLEVSWEMVKKTPLTLHLTTS